LSEKSEEKENESALDLPILRVAGFPQRRIKTEIIQTEEVGDKNF